MSVTTNTNVEVRIKLIKDRKEGSNLLAFASFVMTVPVIGPMAFNHISIRDSQNGVFVSLPAQLKNKGEADEKWWDHYNPVTKEGRQALNELVIGAYEKELAKDN